MKKAYMFLSRNVKGLYKSLVLWLLLLTIGFFTLSFTLVLPESFLLLCLVLVLFAIPTLGLNVLGVISLIQALKRERSFWGALGYVVGGLIFDVLFVLFLFFAAVSIFGFS